MLTNIYKSDFLSIEVSEEKEIAIITWLDNTTCMTDHQYREEILGLVQPQESLTFAPKFIINDTRSFQMPIMPETQEWVGQIWSEKLNDDTIEKYAVIMPEEFIANLSVELTIDEVENNKKLKYFLKLDEAYEWFGIIQ